jgi:hypothetical protein
VRNLTSFLETLAMGQGGLGKVRRGTKAGPRVAKTALYLREQEGGYGGDGGTLTLSNYLIKALIAAPTAQSHHSSSPELTATVAKLATAWPRFDGT